MESRTAIAARDEWSFNACIANAKKFGEEADALEAEVERLRQEETDRARQLMVIRGQYPSPAEVTTLSYTRVLADLGERVLQVEELADEVERLRIFEQAYLRTAGETRAVMDDCIRLVCSEVNPNPDAGKETRQVAPWLWELVQHAYEREEELVGLMARDTCGTDAVHDRYRGALEETRRVIQRVRRWRESQGTEWRQFSGKMQRQS